MAIQLIIFVLMLALGFPFASHPIDCTGLEEADCQTLQNAATAMQEAGSFNNAAFTVSAGGSGGTSEGNTGEISGSGPIILDAEGLTSAADLTFTISFNDEETVTQHYILKDNLFYLGITNETDEPMWMGTDFSGDDTVLIRELLNGQLLAEAFAQPGVVTTLRMEDTEMEGQPMQVFVTEVDLIGFLLTPSVLAQLETVLASLPEDQTGGLTGSDLAGAIQLLPILLSDDTIRYTVWVGEDGLIHHLELYVNIVIDATMIDPTIGETTLNIDFKTDIDGVGETYTVEAPEDFEPMDFDVNEVLSGALSSTGGGEATQVYVVEAAITAGETVTGTLAGANDWDVYSFEAAEGDVVTITLKAPTAESSFDAQLIVLNEAGDEIAFNDDHDSDREDLGSFDALISELTIPADGEYRIVATWLTETKDGDYELTVETAE